MKTLKSTPKLAICLVSLILAVASGHAAAQSLGGAINNIPLNQGELYISRWSDPPLLCNSTGPEVYPVKYTGYGYTTPCEIAGEPRVPAVYASGDMYSFVVQNKYVDGLFDAIDFQAPVNSSGPPLHIHCEADEFWYVFEGEVTFFGYFGPNMTYANVTLGPGGWLYGPMGRAHRFQNMGSTQARMLSFNLPGGLADLQLAAGDVVVDKRAPIPFTQSAAGAMAYLDYLQNDPGENLILPNDGTFDIKDPPRAADYLFHTKEQIDAMRDEPGPLGSTFKVIADESQVGSSTGGAAAVYRVNLPMSDQGFEYLSSDEYWTYIYVLEGAVLVEVATVEGVVTTTNATRDDNLVMPVNTQFRLTTLNGNASLYWINVYADFSYTSLPHFGPDEDSFVTDNFFGFPVDPPLPEACNNGKYDGFRCPETRNATGCIAAQATNTSLQSTLVVNDNIWSLDLENFGANVSESALGDPMDEETDTKYGVCVYVDDELLLEFVADNTKPWQRLSDGYYYDINFRPRFRIKAGPPGTAQVAVIKQPAMMVPSFASQLRRRCGAAGPAKAAQVQVIIPTTDTCFDSGDLRFIVNSGTKFRATNI
eukprot:jgi/Mesvir1/8732/Mv02657-RA.1